MVFLVADFSTFKVCTPFSSFLPFPFLQQHRGDLTVAKASKSKVVAGAVAARVSAPEFHVVLECVTTKKSTPVLSSLILSFFIYSTLHTRLLPLRISYYLLITYHVLTMYSLTLKTQTGPGECSPHHHWSHRRGGPLQRHRRPLSRPPVPRNRRPRPQVGSCTGGGGEDGRGRGDPGIDHGEAEGCC
jgi:hypothetical protein